MLDCHYPESDRIIKKNMRIGIGISGYLQTTEEAKRWLPRFYEYIREYDRQYSEKHNMNPSVKLTTVKPSGTLSLLAGVTPGCHPALYRYYIRNIRMEASSPLVELCRKHGYPISYLYKGRDGYDYSTVVVSFPCCTNENTVTADQLDSIQQLEIVKRLQTEWSDNAVSCTIYYSDEEIGRIREWLAENYQDSIKSVIFCRRIGHGFSQAPYEEISKEKYEELKTKCTPITEQKVIVSDIQEPGQDEDCILGCPVR
jgi:ribonucleotide reductase alpha subunit